MTFQQLNQLGQIIDNACDVNNIDELNTIIAIHSEFTETMEDSIEKTYSYYLLGNAWHGVREIEHEKNVTKVWSLAQEEVFKEIYYFRKAIQQREFENLDVSLQLAVYINLGNAFSHYGRTINAIKYFDKAIALKFWHKSVVNHPNYFMALINKGLTLEYYSELDYDGGHKEFFIKFAYKNFQEAISIINEYLKKNYPDKEYYQEKKDNILTKLKWYEEQFSSTELENSDYFLNYKTQFSKNEANYRKWCLSHKLFLNPLNDLGSYDISTHDPLNLPNLTTDIEEGFPKIITNFNQLKQEYISYRHLLFEGVHEKTPKYYDKETSIIDDYNYNLYNINIEKIKIAFRGFYSIFDKIANFLNEYFYLNMNKNNIYFSNIWYEYENRQKIGIKEIFNKSENLALRGLYLISKDLFDDKQKEFFEVLEPEAQKINDIRNHLEHKFISIKLLDIEKFETYKERNRNFAITEDELQQKTLLLAQLAREAIIYLSFTVHIEEKKKEITDKYATIQLDLKNRGRN
ncbi:LA2681 family HEPN domain-containing protein [Sulfurospirillum barnesii]|uniref:Tetratricopeptide repeat protein n=1 Tax=Sulfurospirillum barnesii (strain ATCC 700032 / DSM 10660 / SES-3) TaxID=760154 RepID=I3XY12_SULBS|nr:LA2681 family HEPN domain-containing protein [Sulfurospirillum barnesii]AFL68836.1 tetratricopeptide repeat protein [Sulfurospirillum barnesii SES-3]